METAELSDFQITGISIFSVLSVATAASNLLTIIAVFRCKREFWSTAFVFIFVQAVADILISCTVPILIYLTVDYSSLRSEQEWNFGKLVKNSNRICKMIFIPIIWHFFFSWTNIVLLTFDRLVAAGYPEAHEKSITKRWVGIACTFGLFISMICTRFVIQTMDTPCKHNQCYTPDTMLARTFSPATFKIAVLPCYFVIIVLFIVVLTEIPTYRRDHSWTKVKTLKMLAILLLLFIIGWLPFLTVMLAYLSNLMPHEYIMKAFLCSFISIGFKCLTTPSAYLIGLHNFKVVAILASIAILGINTITSIAIAKKKGLKKPIHTFILGMAIADWMVGVFIMFDLICRSSFKNDDKETYLDYFVHCIIPTYPLLVASFASNIFQIVIAFDRYTSVVKPIEHRNFITKRVVNGTFLGTFLLSAFLSSMPIYWNNFRGHSNNQSNQSCILLTLNKYFSMGIILPAYLVTFCCLIFIYIQVYRVAVTKPVNEKQAIMMVAVILSCYCIFWLPQLVCMIVLVNNDAKKEEIDHLLEVYNWLLLLAFCNSLVNPIIYSWRMPEIKKSVYKTLHLKTTEDSNSNVDVDES